MIGKARASALLAADTQQSLQNALGESFNLSHLHPGYVRLGRRHAQNSRGLPQALKLTTTSGRVYKLHIGDDTGRFEHTRERIAQAADTGLFPDLHWCDDSALLLEFIPGSRVDFRSPAFACDLAVAMAGLHALGREPANNSRLKAGVRRDLDLLKETAVLRSSIQNYEMALSGIWPDELFCGMDYADIKPGNFLRDEQGRLRFIDAGALRAHRPAGQYLCGSFYLRRMDRRAFAKAYLQAGGLPQLIDQARFLRMLHCIWAAALYVRKMQAVPAWLPVHRFVYRCVSGYLLREFRRLARRSDDSLVSL